jgi:DMSO/TMAO reductase YedYZ heme-binding membrane subunit
MAAVVLTSLLRTRMRNILWRLVHFLSYLFWAVAVVHGVGIGTDMTWENPWGLVVTAACVVVVAFAAAWRLTRLTRLAAGRHDLVRSTA